MLARLYSVVELRFQMRLFNRSLIAAVSALTLTAAPAFADPATTAAPAAPAAEAPAAQAAEATPAAPAAESDAAPETGTKKHHGKGKKHHHKHKHKHHKKTSAATDAAPTEAAPSN